MSRQEKSEDDSFLQGGRRLAHEQLAILGLRAPNKQPSLFSDFFHFLSDLAVLLVRRLWSVFCLPLRLGALSVRVLGKIKGYVVRKLVWGRGRLYSPVVRLAMLSLVLAVFLVGSTGWVQSQVLIGPLTGKGADILVEASVSAPVSFENAPSGEPLKYVVKEGETLSSIGEQFKVSVSSIVSANGITNINLLRPGQELTIPPVSGVLHTVKKGDTVEKLAAKYEVSPQSIVDFNYLFAPFKLVTGTILVVPGGKIPDSAAPSVDHYAREEKYSGRVGSLGTGQFSWPTNYHSISQYYSSWHPAIDISKFSPIYAIDSGTVVEVRYGGWNYGYGKMIRINHGNGYRSLYAHLSSVKITVGQKVSRGQVLGNMGNTGRSFGTHLHLEITRNGQHINPLSVL